MSNDKQQDLNPHTDDEARIALFTACSWWDYGRFCEALKIAGRGGPKAAERIRELTNQDLADEWKERNLGDFPVPQPPDEDLN